MHNGPTQQDEGGTTKSKSMKMLYPLKINKLIQEHKTETQRQASKQATTTTNK